MRAVDGLLAILTRRADPSVAAVCRIVAGAAALLQIATEEPLLARLFEAAGIVRAPNFAWLPAPGPGGAAALVVAGLLAAIGFSLGFLTRTCGILLACVMGYRLVLDQNLYSHHVYLLVLVVALLVLAGAGAAVSMDQRLGWRNVPDIPNWPLTLIRVQISLMYLFAGLAKLNPVFLSGDLLRMRGRLPAITGGGDALVVAAWAVVFCELFVAAALWSPRLRSTAFTIGVMFHVSTVLLLERFPSPGLIVFGMVSVSCYPLFFDAGRGELVAWFPRGRRASK